MNLTTALLAGSLCMAAAVSAQSVPDNLVAEGIPAHTPELRREVSRYLEFRTAGFLGWHPVRKEMLIVTRFADTLQLHSVQQPGGARKQLTFLPEPVAGGSYQPKEGRCIVFSQDTGGGEFYQFYRYDLADGRITLITDGKSRNTSLRWAKSGKRVVWSSTRRNGKDTDIWVMDPFKPESARILLERQGGGWAISDWAEDEDRLLLGNYTSINESALYVYTPSTQKIQPLLPPPTERTAYSDGRFSRDGRSVYCTTDQGAEFKRLVRIDVETQAVTVLAPDLKWDVDAFEISPDGKRLAAVSNEDGVSVLRILNARTGAIETRRSPELPMGVIGNIDWHENNRDLGFSLSHAQSPSDCYSLDTRNGKVTRWTESETGGLDASKFSVPTLVRTRSFDGLEISGFLYRPDPKRFPGKRPIILNIHGGPESQSRPIFQGRNNFLMDELGVAILFPNVRGSAGYGKRFLTLDNGELREDSVKDIGAFIDWVRTQPDLDTDRIAVTGGSYGGYMTLASMTHYNDRLRCGVDVVGISNFVTFLENTQDYRRDLRRAEYGDERDPKMREHLIRISPTTNVRRITRPMFIVQGRNDPRVPVTEAEQMVKAIRDNGGSCWYLMAKDEGHGFAKKKNADFQFLSTVMFWREHLLGNPAVR